MSAPIGITLLDFFAIGKKAVQLYPVQERSCLQPKTWRVLQKERGSELSTNSLGAVPSDAQNHFFWSASWHMSKYNPNAITYDWPMVTAYELYNEKQNPFDKTGVRDYIIEVAVLDVYKEAECIGKGDGCSNRPINQIYLDTEVILDNLLQYFGQLVLATTSVEAEKRVYYHPYLKGLVAENKGFSFEVITDLGSTISSLNKSARFMRVERPAQNIFGTKVQLTLRVTNCVGIAYQSHLPDYGVIGYEVGCKNC